MLEQLEITATIKTLYKFLKPQQTVLFFKGMCQVSQILCKKQT